METKLNLIAALGQDRVIGKNNELLWKIPDDLKRFKALTTGHPIIMGRKTFESIGRVLPGRTNIVITRNTELKIEGALICNSFEEAIRAASKIDSEIFIIGGAEIYRQAIDKADRLYLTVIDEKKDGDAFFPDYSKFTKIVSEENKTTDTGLRYQWFVLEKN